MKGKIVRWEDNRGFGFIKSSEHNKEVFVHISKFKRGYRRPQTGDLVEFDLDISTPKPTAVRANLIGAHHKSANRGPSATITFGTILLPLLIWFYAEYISPKFNKTQSYPSTQYSQDSQLKPSIAPQFSNDDISATPFSSNSGVSQKFSCEGKQYCSEMASCEEAMFYLQNCPNVKIDGNNDGIPCERQHCR